jgi:transcriptional regulator NrdR family protein
MICPLCKTKTDVVDTRTLKRNQVKRRRVCINGHIFSTKEEAVTAPEDRSLKSRRA